MIRALKRTELLGLLLLLAGHLLAARTSFGYHHPDEHYQILEWANHLVGLNPDANSLPWEFAARIRPWFQPMLHAIYQKLLLMAGIYEPFGAVEFARGIYALLNVFVLLRIWTFIRERYGIDSLWFVWISLLWFLPYLHVRTSSENLSGILLSLGLLSLVQEKPPLRSGLWLGFAFLARYQVALGLLPLGLALLYRARAIRKEHWLLLLGFLLPVAFGVILDRIGYGTWVFSPYLYFKVNLLDGVAARYNPYPWWMYLSWLFQLNPLINLPLFLGLLRFSFREKGKEPLVLGSFILGFFFLHCFLTNKEYRFLFPVVNWVPFMAAVALRGFTQVLRLKRWWIPYTALNGIAFSVSTLHGAALLTLGAPMLAHRHLNPSLPVLASRDYRTTLPVYHLPDHDVIPLRNPQEIKEALGRKASFQVLLDGKYGDAGIREMKDILEASCERSESVAPEWVYRLGEKYGILRHLPYIAWYRCL